MANKTIITLKGGLGNQLFQYAHGIKLALIDKKEVLYDTTFFVTDKKEVDRPFLMDKFNIDPHANFKPVHENIVKKYYKKIKQKLTGEYNFFQNENYFKDAKQEVLKQFTLKDPFSPAAEEKLRTITSYPNSVSLHIRRGDYVANPHTTLVDLNYYYKAIDYIKSKVENPVFCVFSDDMNWVTEHLHAENLFFISSPEIKDYEELMLMSSCAHNIIANSTFSWWGAYLNKNPQKIVISPTKWTVFQKGIVLADWIQIS